jgi:hypothetical protein
MPNGILSSGKTDDFIKKFLIYLKISSFKLGKDGIP